MPRLLDEVRCVSPEHQHYVPSTMFKYEDAFVLQAVEKSDPPFALRKQALPVTAFVCKVCGYVELYAEKSS